jgi:hypothetical protein
MITLIIDFLIMKDSHVICNIIKRLKERCFCKSRLKIKKYGQMDLKSKKYPAGRILPPAQRRRTGGRQSGRSSAASGRPKRVDSSTYGCRALKIMIIKELIFSYFRQKGFGS